MNENAQSIEILLVPVLLVIGIFVLVALVQSIDSIYHEWRRLNLEVKRTHGKEKKYWKKRRRRLLWSILPFIKY